MKTHCTRCGKKGKNYPVGYITPDVDGGEYHCVDLCFDCAREHSKMMADWMSGREESE